MRVNALFLSIFGYVTNKNDKKEQIMGIDVLEYEIQTRFPELGNDMANWIGFRYTDSKKMFKALYNKALDRFLDSMRKLSKKILEATEQLKSTNPLADSDRNK